MHCSHVYFMFKTVRDGSMLDVSSKSSILNIHCPGSEGKVKPQTIWGLYKHMKMRYYSNTGVYIPGRKAATPEPEKERSLRCSLLQIFFVHIISTNIFQTSYNMAKLSLAILAMHITIADNLHFLAVITSCC